MSRFLSIVALCSVLILGALFGPTLRDTVMSRWLKTPEAVAALDQREVTTPAYMQAFLSWVGGYVMNMMGGLVDSQLAAVNKFIAGKKELLQSELNMKAAIVVTDRFAEANDKFNIAPERTCRVLNESKETAHAMVLADVNRKAWTRMATKRLSDADNSTATASAVIDQHNTSFCSATDVDRGRCAVVSTMPNADITASTLFLSEGSETMSEQQFRAAQAFAQMATRPVPIEDLPKGFEATPAGQRFLLEKKHSIAMDSLVAGTFARILASRSPRN